MKVHPAPRKRGNITFHYNVNRSLAEVERMIVGGRGQKKLRRLPHIFSKVLELPFGSDADVDVHEDAAEFVFVVVAAAEDFGEGVRAHAVQIHPGVTKVVIRDGGGGGDGVDDLELDRWRFRLPSCTRPELAVARYDGEELVVTIPKGGGSADLSADDGEVWGRGDGDDGIGRLIFVHSNQYNQH